MTDDWQARLADGGKHGAIEPWKGWAAWAGRSREQSADVPSTDPSHDVGTSWFVVRVCCRRGACVFCKPG